VLDRQLYHLQNSVVLVTGALDMLCWFVAALEGCTPDRFLIDRGQLFGPKKEPKWLQRSRIRQRWQLGRLLAISEPILD
jgi:hypothetical protein